MTYATEYEGLVGEHEPEVPDAAPEAPPACTCAASERALRPELVEHRGQRRVRIDGRVEVLLTVQRHRPPQGLPLWVASATLDTPRGPMQWSATASEQEVARRLAERQGIVGFDLGQVFGQLFGGANGNSNQRATQRGAQNLAVQRVVRDVRNAIDSPAGRAVTNVLSSIPGLGAVVGPAVQATRAATTVVDNVARGNPRARANLAQLQRAAQRGHPAARRAVNVVEGVLRTQRRQTIARARGPVRPQRNATPAEERAWREADAVWNAYRAARTAQGLETPEPLITPPPRS